MPCARATSRQPPKAFEQAIAADPHSGALLRNLASAHRGAGDDEAEMKALERALDVDRRDVVAWMRKAELHQRRDEKGEAFQAWNAALQLAEPLRPWSGPMAEALERGQAFAAVGVTVNPWCRRIEAMAPLVWRVSTRPSGAVATLSSTQALGPAADLRQ